MAGPNVTSDKRDYSINDPIKLNVGFKVMGGLRESFHPDVWTVAWEDFDKILRLTVGVSVSVPRGPVSRKVAEIKKEVRKASFYWSRDPDLPYRIWAMIIPEKGGPPLIPRNVEDAKSKMFDFDKNFEVEASTLGPGTHKIAGKVSARWGRRSFIEKGSIAGKSKPAVISVG